MEAEFPHKPRVDQKTKTALVLAMARLPTRLRSSRQLARESLLHGAIQKPAEFGALLSLVRRLKPNVIVELGVSQGGTMYGFQRAAPNATALSIDIGSDAATIRRDSHDPHTLNELRRLLDGRPIDLLFIDADHTYGGVRADFEMYAPLVRSGGIVAFHDILPHPAYPEFEVHQYWQEISQTGEFQEFIDLSDWGWGQWGGIGVLTMP
jgi:predicted O-methyltransferase YrrM